MDREMPDWCETEEWCPITITAELLGRKWHPVIIHRLMQRPLGFNKLQEEVHGISSKVLSDSLEDLQGKNVVEKKVIQESPKKVEYSLTQKGETLRPVIEEMLEWGENSAED
jgi:DNA-binding HxlR family transcriptional regulator